MSELSVTRRWFASMDPRSSRLRTQERDVYVAVRDLLAAIDRGEAKCAQLRHLLWLALNGRCLVCDWPLAQHLDKGCVPDNCSYRPDDPVEQAKLHHRRAFLAELKLPHMTLSQHTPNAESR